MKPLRTLLLTLLCLCGGATLAQATTYHVAKNGVDSRTCTNAQSVNQPLLNIQTALNCMSTAGGNTVIVHGGTYFEGNLRAPSGASATAQNTVQAGTGETVVVKPLNQDSCAILLTPNNKFVTWDQINLDGHNSNDTANLSYTGICEDSAAPDTTSNITFKNAEVRYFRRSGIGIGGQAHVIDRAYIHDNGTTCCTTGQDDHGVYWQAGNSTISNSIFVNPTAGYNIQFHSGANNNNNVFKNNRLGASRSGGLAADTGSGHHIVNNVIAGSGTDGNGCGICYASGDFFYNNTIANNSSQGIFGRGSNTYLNNISCGNTGGQVDDSGSTYGSSNYSATTCPATHFTSTSPITGADFYHLLSTASNFIDTGTGTGAAEASPDPDGVVRGPFDRGAFERTASASPAATSLAFVQAPTNTAQNGTISPAVTVRILDQNGALFGSGTNAITIAIGTNPSSGTLAGTLVKNAVNGVATFNNLSINNSGNGYTLTAAASGLSGATSSTFNITATASPYLKQPVLNVSWTYPTASIPEEMAVEVYRSVSGKSTGELLGRADPGATSIQVRPTETGTYCVMVVGKVGLKSSAFSSEVCTTVPTPTVNTPTNVGVMLAP